MSTNNFSYENILVVCPDFSFKHDCVASECEVEKPEDCQYFGESEEWDEFSFDEYVDEMRAELAKIGFEDCDKWENCRDGGKIISKWGLEDSDGMIKWLEVVVRSGYYDGQNIDYIIDGDFGLENESNKKQVAHYEAMNRKFDRQVAKLEKVLCKYGGTEMLKVAQFSNGEAVYQLKK